MSFPNERPQPGRSDDLVAYLNRPPLDGEVSHIAGNATVAAKALIHRWHALLHRPDGFIVSVASRVQVTDVSILDKYSTPGAPREARVTFEVSVTDGSSTFECRARAWTNLLVDMLDPNGHVLQEIAFMLIDELRDRFQQVLMHIPPILSLIITGVFFFSFFF